MIEENGRTFMITEYVGGGDLNDLLIKTAKSSKKKLSDSQVSLIIKHVLNGVRHIHSHEIVHRDIKPSMFHKKF